MSAPASVKHGSSGIIAMLLTGLWLVIWRWLLGTPWGFSPVPASGGLVNIGVLYNSTDTWSYLSWVQQYYHGANLAGLIYTTEAHAALLWLFPLWLIGKVAAWTGLPVLGVYNAAGLSGAMVAVWCFLRAATALGLPASARHWAAFALVTGSGGSWLWHLAHKLGWASVANGGDLFFLDLFPSTSFLVYAYHAVGLALLTALWWTSAEAETRLIAKQAAAPWLTASAGLALLLAFSRPYEPIAFLGAWSLKTAWHGLHRRAEPAAWRASLLIWFVLGVALVPGIGLTVWVSTRPVWSTFAHQSLALGLDRSAWLWTLGGWIVLVALGAGPAVRTNTRLALLPLAASLLLGLILLGLGSAQTKLSSGLILGPILLSGWGAVRLVAILGRLPRLFRIGVAGLLLAALLGTASLFMNLHAIKLDGPTLVEADLVALADQLPFRHGAKPPVVLTDADTGAILPGLTGARVWVGHWSLSAHYKPKVAQLRTAGLDSLAHPSDRKAANQALDSILADARFDYALIDGRCHSVLEHLRNLGWRRLDTSGRWSLLAAPLLPPARRS